MKLPGLLLVALAAVAVVAVPASAKVGCGCELEGGYKCAQPKKCGTKDGKPCVAVGTMNACCKGLFADATCQTCLTYKTCGTSGYAACGLNPTKCDEPQATLTRIGLSMLCALPKVRVAPKVDLKAWMKRVPDATKLAGMSIPGTHDSGAKDASFTVDGKLPTPVCNTFGRCQSGDITAQLSVGIRYFDLRLSHDGGRYSPLQVFHGICRQKVNLKEIFEQTTKYLTANPSEVVLWRVKIENDSSSKRTNDKSKFVASFAEEFKKYEKFDAGQLGAGAGGTTLGSVRGKIIVLDNTGLDKGYTPFRTLTIQDIYDQACYGGKKVAILENLKSAVANSKAGGSALHLNHISFAAFGNKNSLTAEAASRVLNPWFGDHLLSAKYKSTGLGMISMDFVNDYEWICHAIVGTNPGF